MVPDTLETKQTPVIPDTSSLIQTPVIPDTSRLIKTPVIPDTSSLQCVWYKMFGFFSSKYIWYQTFFFLVFGMSVPPTFLHHQGEISQCLSLLIGYIKKNCNFDVSHYLGLLIVTTT